jgi:hypothetical protein
MAASLDFVSTILAVLRLLDTLLFPFLPADAPSVFAAMALFALRFDARTPREFFWSRAALPVLAGLS